MDRGQVHTLEAFIAALLLISGIIFATQVTAVTPLSASTSNQHIENQLRSNANDLLTATDESGALEAAVVHWNTTNRQFVGSPSDGMFVDGGPPNAFGESLNTTFKSRNIVFNVYITYQRVDDTRTDRMVYMGRPSDNAVSASRLVFLYNDTLLTGPEEIPVSDAPFYRGIESQSDGELFNVLEVRIVVWRM